MGRHLAANGMTLLIVALVVVVGLITWGQEEFSGPGPTEEAVVVEIPRGANLARALSQEEHLYSTFMGALGSFGLEVSEAGINRILEVMAIERRAEIKPVGIDARFRAPNDIEVEGQKVSGTGGFFDGSTLFYQGTVLVDMDPAMMFQSLNLPAPQPGPDGEMPKPRALIPSTPAATREKAPRMARG